jgi:hypothetical protein
METKSPRVSDQKIYSTFDRELIRADLSVTALHALCDRMGVSRSEGTRPLATVERLRHLLDRHADRSIERVQIGCNFRRQPQWKFLMGVPLIYVPILVGILPLVACTFLVRTHLTLVGGHKLKSYWEDFVPSWVSHRYTWGTQILPDRVFKRYWFLAWIAKSKLFWLFNCKLYCPLSVALIAYLLYLVKIVEHWWCPFGHDKKPTYADAPIDKSLWHAAGDASLLHPDDRENPAWNEDGL